MTQATVRVLAASSLLWAALTLPAEAQWSIETLPTPRSDIGMTAAGSEMYFLGGGEGPAYSDVVDVYDEATGTWSSLTLPNPMARASAATVDKGFFGDSVFYGAGWSDVFPGLTNDELYEYDTLLGTWTTHHLSMPRYDVGIGAVGKYLVVAGGIASGAVTDRVDVLDTATGTWSQLTLPNAVRDSVAVSAGNRLYLAGGKDSSTATVDYVQYVEPATGTTGSLSPLSMDRHGMSGAAVGPNLWFIGGLDASFNPTDRYDRIDLNSGAQTFGSLPSALSNSAATAAGNRLVAGGGSDAPGGFGAPVAKVFVIEVDGTMTETVFPAPVGQDPPETQMLNASAASTARSAYFAGGLDASFSALSRVMIYTHPDEFLVDVGSLSLTTGGTATHSLEVGAGQAFTPYIVLGSVSGTSPGFVFGGVTVPLNIDPYLNLTLTGANSPPFVDTWGSTDATGSAQAQFVLPTGLNPGLAGATLSHAAVLFSVPALQILHVTNTQDFDIVP